MALYGGFILPVPVETDTGHRTTGALLWGKLVPISSKMLFSSVNYNTKKGPVTQHTFLVAYGRKRFQRVEIRSDNEFCPAVLQMVAGERVVVFGLYEEYEYMARERKEIAWVDEDGKKHKRNVYEEGGEKVQKTDRTLKANFVIPARAVIDPVGYYASYNRPEDPTLGYAAFQEDEEDRFWRDE